MLLVVACIYRVNKNHLKYIPTFHHKVLRYRLILFSQMLYSCWFSTVSRPVKNVYFFHFLLYENSLTVLFLKNCKYGYLWLKAKLSRGDCFASDVLLPQCYLDTMQRTIVQWCDFILIIAIFLLYSHHFFVLFCKHFSFLLRNMSPAYYRQ